MGKNVANLRIGAVTALFIVVSVIQCAATTYTCTAAQDKARLGIDTGSVNVNGHDRICDFSVNGVSPTGARVPAFLNVLNHIFDGSFSRDSLHLEEDIQTLLISPFFPDGANSNIGNDVRSEIRSNARDIAVCIDDFSRGNFNTSRIQRNNIVCRAVRRGDVRFSDVEVDGNETILQIGVSARNQTFNLFIPAELMQAGRGGFRFR